MSKVVAIRIRSADPLTYADSSGLDLRPHKYVVVQGEKGPELGQVVRTPQDVV
jgi:cell fate regulator YaaT (PSP1 superfamily)